MSEQLPCLQHILLYNDAPFQNCKTLEKPGWFTLLINQGKIRIIKQASWIFMTCRWCSSMCSSLKHPANDVQWRRIRGTFLPLFSFLQGILKKTKKSIKHQIISHNILHGILIGCTSATTHNSWYKRSPTQCGWHGVAQKMPKAGILPRYGLFSFALPGQSFTMILDPNLFNLIS